MGKRLDLRGADLRQVDLSGLSLVSLYGGLIWNDWRDATPAQREAAAIHLEGANLYGTHLEKAILNSAHLEEAYLGEVHLTGAELNGAYLEGVDFWRAHLEGSFLSKAHLEGANFYKAHLEEALLGWAHLEGAVFRFAHLEGTNLYLTHLEKVDLRNAFFNNATNLEGIDLGNEEHGFAFLADLSWGGVNLAVVGWATVKMLGEEFRAHQRQTKDGGVKNRKERLSEYEVAVRANRQLATVLRDQGLNEEADHFAYRAQKLQHIVLRRQRKFGRYLFLGCLDLLAGYGYRPGRSVFWYLAILCGFALAYYTFGHLLLWPPDAFIYSLTSFHGRGFFPGLEGKRSLHDPLIILAAFEAVVGLFIEISFIATFTQRYFGR